MEFFTRDANAEYEILVPKDIIRGCKAAAGCAYRVTPGQSAILQVDADADNGTFEYEIRTIKAGTGQDDPLGP